LVIGRVTRPHGVRGELRVAVYTELPERFTWLERVFVGLDDPQPYEVTGVRFHQNLVLLQLKGIDNRDAADGLRGAWLQIPEEEGIPLEEGEVYLHDIMGLTMVTTAGRVLGEIVEIIETAANDVYVVRGAQGEILVPDIPDVVIAIQPEEGTVVIEPLPGLLPDDV
jgi:16S rRNA processing protein RimM